MNTLYVMVGLPGSGKSTYANKFAEEISAKVVSSDAIRAELFGDESIQSKPALVFDIVYERIEDTLKQGQDVILDATNIRRRDRGNAIVLAGRLGAKCEAIVMGTPSEVCWEHNCARERVVPRYAFEKMLEHMSFPSYSEGFDYVRYVEVAE